MHVVIRQRDESQHRSEQRHQMKENSLLFNLSCEVYDDLLFSFKVLNFQWTSVIVIRIECVQCEIHVPLCRTFQTIIRQCIILNWPTCFKQFVSFKWINRRLFEYSSFIENECFPRYLLII